MAKYDVTFSCGCTETIELFGKCKYRYETIEYYREKGLCSKCYAKKIDENMRLMGYTPIMMLYREYKENYAMCKTQPDSYDSKRKSIVVYVKLDNKEAGGNNGK